MTFFRIFQTLHLGISFCNIYDRIFYSMNAGRILIKMFEQDVPIQDNISDSFQENFNIKIE